MRLALLHENIDSFHQAQRVVHLRARYFTNMMVGRVGGNRHALHVHDMMQAAYCPMWCGSIPEELIARILKLNSPTKANLILPKDVSVIHPGSLWFQHEFLGSFNQN